MKTSDRLLPRYARAKQISSNFYWIYFTGSIWQRNRYIITVVLIACTFLAPLAFLLAALLALVVRKTPFVALSRTIVLPRQALKYNWSVYQDRLGTTTIEKTLQKAIVFSSPRAQRLSRSLKCDKNLPLVLSLSKNKWMMRKIKLAPSFLSFIICVCILKNASFYPDRLGTIYI